VSRKVLLAPEASSELHEAARWYEDRRSGVGLAFLAAVDRAMQQLAAWPESGTPAPGVPADLQVRRIPIPSFPYYLAYLVAADAIHVLAVAHVRRRPGYWNPRAKP
jgi:toxin ParE1/3/4